MAENGSDGVMNFVTSAAGSQGRSGFDEYSYALGANYPVVALENSAGYYTMPDAYDVAVSLTKAQINYTHGPDYLLETLNEVYTYHDPRTYPLSLLLVRDRADGSHAPARDRCQKRPRSYDEHAEAPDIDRLRHLLPPARARVGDGPGSEYSPLPINLVEASFQQGRPAPPRPTRP